MGKAAQIVELCAQLITEARKIEKKHKRKGGRVSATMAMGDEMEGWTFEFICRRTTDEDLEESSQDKNDG